MESFERKEQPSVSLTLEEASEEDLATLIDVERSVEKSKTYSPMLSERAWKEELAGNTVKILKVGDVAVGSIAYTEKAPGHIYISGVIVRPEYQGRGIATSAIKSILEENPDAERIDLVTHPENSALQLYESLGFVVEDRKENYYGDGEPRLVLARTNNTEDPPISNTD